MSETIAEANSENELQRKLQQHFDTHGWVAIREVSPHEANVKADLIVRHDAYGWLGIETKYFDGDGGAKLADAHHQIISKYRGRRYLGEEVNLWAICPFFTGYESDEWHQQRANWRNSFVREFFCRQGVGYVNPSRSPLLIDFAYSTAPYKIPVDADKETRYHENVDIERIRTSVQAKITKYDY